MKFRTFYDRCDDSGKEVVVNHKEINSCESIVQPNLTLSLRDIYERWKRNEPLDIQLRNGSYLLDEKSSDKDEERAFDAVDPDAGDIVDYEEEVEMAIESRQHASAMAARMKEQNERQQSEATKDEQQADEVDESVIP